jgi:signal transduction histidine kinase
MGGTIRIARAPGGGTTVTFTLPAEPVDEQAQPAAEALT